MREFLFLSLGEYSNFINSHFWNLNNQWLNDMNTKNNNTDEIDEYIVVEENPNILYNDYNQPRTLIFDTSISFKTYHNRNNKVTKEFIENIEKQDIPVFKSNVMEEDNTFDLNTDSKK